MNKSRALLLKVTSSMKPCWTPDTGWIDEPKEAVMTNEKSLEEYAWEYTDTFGGEANYSWIKRGNVRAATLQKAYVLARKAIGLTGSRGRKDEYGDMISFKPYNSCTVLFVN